jgi:putative intracellular protease/amidase
VNPDKLRMDENAVSFVRDFFETGKPIGTICHGPWTLVEAGVVSGRTLTSYPSVRTDLRNAGANAVDQEVVTDQGLVSSRSPTDLPGLLREDRRRVRRRAPHGTPGEPDRRDADLRPVGTAHRAGPRWQFAQTPW